MKITKKFLLTCLCIVFFSVKANASTDLVDISFNGSPAIKVDLALATATTGVKVQNPKKVNSGLEELEIKLIGKEVNQRLGVTVRRTKLTFVKVEAGGNNLDMPSGKDVKERYSTCERTTECEIEIDGNVVAVIHKSK